MNATPAIDYELANAPEKKRALNVGAAPHRQPPFWGG